MKKFVIAAIAIFTLTAFATDISTKLMYLLTSTCPGTGKMHYKTVRELASIDFLLHGSYMQAFYNRDDEGSSTSLAINYQNLPCHSQALLESRFKGYAASEVIKMEHTTEGILYYVWLAKGREKVIAQVSTSGEMSIFKEVAP